WEVSTVVEERYSSGEKAVSMTCCAGFDGPQSSTRGECLEEKVSRIVTPEGILPDTDKISAVLAFPVPSDVRQVRQFLGLTSYYQRFVNNYARHAEPLFALTRRNTPFVWNADCQQAMDYLRSCLTSAPILSFPDFDRPFCLHTDACVIGLGAVLMQRDNAEREVVIAYASGTLHKSEKPYSMTEKECLGVIWALEHFRPCNEGLPVSIYTDHSSLKWLMSRPSPSGCLARWCLHLQDFGSSINLVIKTEFLMPCPEIHS
ncbi:hypothetical protein NFI96_025872, partial [Prochilodus magdalenae]